MSSSRPPKSNPRTPSIDEVSLIRPKAAVVRPTASPYVWVSASLNDSELRPVVGSRIRLADRFFESRAAAARYIPPSEFNYEVGAL